jgi:predicted dehydrogenase
VLCEKPFAMNAAEAARDGRRRRGGRPPLIEAFHYRYHPVITDTVRLVARAPSAGS